MDFQHYEQPVGHSGVYAPSPNVSTPISAGPGSSLHIGGDGPIITTAYPRRKPTRAAQACDACRQQKAKCDEGRPSCGSCRDINQPCVYKEVTPKKIDPIQRKILDTLTRIEGKLSGNDDDPAPPAGAAPPAPQPQNLQDLSAAAPSLQSTGLSINTGELYHLRSSSGGPGEFGELSIPIAHTAAHKLLRWPVINAFVGKITDNEDYVMEQEESRGLLRVYGRGEVREDEPSKSLWDTRFTSGDNAEVRWGEAHGVEEAHGVGGLNADGSLHLNPLMLRRLLNSYFQNIHILHPFLDKECIINAAFAAKASSAGASYSTPFAISSMQKPPVTTLKRKRSTTAPVDPNMSNNTVIRTPIESSIGTALVLLVLALGKICDYGTWVPGPVPDNKSSPRTMMSPPSGTFVKHSPTLSASSTYSKPSKCPRMPNTSHRTPLESHAAFEKEPFEPRNVDVIPGLAYYALAIEILGTLMGGNSLPHIQAGLLAGLYCGQLGRVLESWKWINWACTSCQVLIRGNKLNCEPDELRKDLIICAFWTCLQLESDILAELDLSPSGLSRYEEIVPLPRCTGWGMTDPTGNDPESVMWMYYLAQITLRKLLNRVHSELYRENKDLGWSTELVAELDRQLRQWKSVLPAQLRWEDNDPPPADINAARLRAKYYEARHIIHRPFVHRALHPLVPHGTYPILPEQVSSQITGRLSSENSPANPANTTFKPTGVIAMAPPESVESTVDKSVIDACKNCIGAAMRSTMAFHGVHGRPIVTNISGTAHAQFGNLLVLQAAYRSQLLRTIVHPVGLEYLMKKTIQFLRHLTPISPALGTDAAILESSMETLPLRDGGHPVSNPN